MSISKYNSEGYPDPTAYGALSSIESETHALRAFRPIVYICSPFAGDIEKNVAPPEPTAALQWNKDISPSHHTCCFHSF